MLSLLALSVAIHNKNGKGLLPLLYGIVAYFFYQSQSTIKMEKGYYVIMMIEDLMLIKVAIHNKNGKGLLQEIRIPSGIKYLGESQSTIKMEKGYYGLFAST